MSLLPILFYNNWDLQRPSHILDVERMLSPSNHRTVNSRPHYYQSRSPEAAKQGSSSRMVADKDKFQVDLNVHNFSPEELAVKVCVYNMITVEGKHEEKQDELGFVSRQFVRRCVLPDGYDINNVVSSLSSDGVLSIKAPRIGQPSDENAAIPIRQTGCALKSVASQEKTEQISQEKD